MNPAPGSQIVVYTEFTLLPGIFDMKERVPVPLGLTYYGSTFSF